MGPGHLVYQILLVLLLSSDDVVVWGCNEALTITTPSPMEALSGSCLNIPCTYQAIDISIDLARPITGIWTKGSIFRNRFSISGDPSKSYPMNITGNLKNRDCTTMFSNINWDHEDKYYFKIENGVSGDRAIAVCTHLQISLRDSPWSPSIKISGDQTEAEVVTITCSAVTPCPHAPPRLTWNLHQGTANITETNPDRTVTTAIKVNITLTDSHDGQMINCSAEYPVSGGVKMAESNITLSVTYGPKNTSVRVSPSGTLSAGQSVTLRCSSRAKPPVQKFTWFRHSSQGPVSVREGDTFSFNFSQNIHGQYYCEAKNRVGKQTSSVIHVGPEGVKTVGGSSQASVIAGAVIGVLLLVIVVFAIWHFKMRRKSAKRTQSLSAAAAETRARGEVQCGQNDFPKLRHEAKGPETSYSQVKVSNMADATVYTPLKY